MHICCCGSLHPVLSPSTALPGTQSFWYKPGIVTAQTLVESSISDSQQMASILAARAPTVEIGITLYQSLPVA